jgi:hypothetical protein
MTLSSARFGLASILAVAIIVTAAMPAAAETTPTDAPATTGVAADTVTTPTTTPSTTTGTTAPASSSGSDADRSDWLSVGVILLGFALGGGLLAYLYLIQRRFFEAEETALRLTKVALPTDSIDPLFGRLDLVLATESETPTKLEIEAPPSVLLGKEAELKVTPPDGATLSDVAWTVEPATAASLEPDAGTETTKLKAKAAGTLIVVLAAKVTKNGDVTEGRGSVTFLAEEVPPAPAGLPFVGEGYGTILLTILLITVVGVLGLANVLDGDVIATLFGTLAGYFFVREATSASASSDSGAAGTETTGSTSDSDA